MSALDSRRDADSIQSRRENAQKCRSAPEAARAVEAKKFQANQQSTEFKACVAESVRESLTVAGKGGGVKKLFLRAGMLECWNAGMLEC